MGTDIECRGQRRSEGVKNKEKKDVPRVPQSMLEDPPSNPLRNLVDSLLQLSSDSLSLECFDSIRVGSCWHNDECDDSRLGSSFFESVVESWLLACVHVRMYCEAMHERT